MPADPDQRRPSDDTRTLYDVLGVSEDASPEEVTRVYRQTALRLHPDKGGDADVFDEIAKAYKVLEDEKQRESYDDELAKVRDRAGLVEGAPKAAGTAVPGFSAKQTQEPMRAKTAPTPGSKRQGKMACAQPGKTHVGVALEWRGLGSGAAAMKMICDGVSTEGKAERVLEKYVDLPRNKGKRRDWMKGIRGEEKQELKAAAKRREEAEKEKWNKWLNRRG